MKYVRPVLIAITAVLGLFIFNLHVSAFGVFLRPIMDEFGWSRASVSSVSSFSLLISAVVLLLAGFAFDWRGGRLIIIIGSVLAALGGYSLSTIHSQGQFTLWYYVFSAGGALFGGIAPYLILANWFVRLRGIFAGVIIAVASVGTIFGPPIFAGLVSSFGWRPGYVTLGLLSLILIPFAIFVRRRPEDEKSTPDFGMVSNRGTLLGKGSWLSARRFPPAYDSQGIMGGFRAYPLTLGKNKGTASVVLAVLFYLVIIFVSYSAYRGILVHMFPAMVDAGAKAMAAATMMTLITIGTAIGALVLGVVSDFIHSRWCMTIALFLLGAGILVFNANPLSFLAPLMLGLGAGGLICMTTIVLADYFGRGFLGSLRGIAGLFIAGGTVAGPLLLGYNFDATGSYSSGFIAIGIGVLVCMLLSIFMFPPDYEKLIVKG